MFLCTARQIKALGKSPPPPFFGNLGDVSKLNPATNHNILTTPRSIVCEEARKTKVVQAAFTYYIHQHKTKTHGTGKYRPNWNLQPDTRSRCIPHLQFRATSFFNINSRQRTLLIVLTAGSRRVNDVVQITPSSNGLLRHVSIVKNNLCPKFVLAWKFMLAMGSLSLYTETTSPFQNLH